MLLGLTLQSLLLMLHFADVATTEGNFGDADVSPATSPPLWTALI